MSTGLCISVNSVMSLNRRQSSFPHQVFFARPIWYYLLQVQGQVSGIFSAKNSDTRLWNVDNSVILNVGGSLFRKLNRDDEQDYIATMIIFPFVFGSLNHLTSADKFLQSDHLELTKTVKLEMKYYVFPFLLYKMYYLEQMPTF